MTDVLLVATLSGWINGRGVAGDARWLPSKATCALIGALILAGIWGLHTAREFGTSTKMGLFEFRPLLSYLLVFPIVGRTRSVCDLGSVGH